MKILPPVTQPWRTRIARRHDPPAGRGRRAYRRYRQCLRWEFGFTCAFCLCHEADLILHGVEGSGETGIEHHVPVSHGEAAVHEYRTCFYACRYCNQDRAAQANVDPQSGARLLNPCDDPWADHFRATNDKLMPRGNDLDALYTHRVYNLDHPRKVRMRRLRRKAVRELLQLLLKGPQLHARLLERAVAEADPALIEEAQLLALVLRRAGEDLERFKIVPFDAKRPCICSDEAPCTLPQLLAEQAIEVELTVEAAGPQAQELPPALARAVAELPGLDDVALWRVARDHLPQPAAAELEALNLKQQREGLNRSEEDALDRLTEAYERFLLLRAEAASLLRRRGHDVSELVGPG